MDDGQWHLLELHQHGQKQFSVRVDDRAPAMLSVPNDPDRRNVFSMSGPFYVGGLPADLLQSRPVTTLHGLTNVSGFVGCLATLTVNGVLHDPTTSLPPAVVPGCRSKSFRYL